MLCCISVIDCSTGKSRLTRLSARDTAEASSGNATLLQLPETAAGMEGAEHHLQVESGEKSWGRRGGLWPVDKPVVSSCRVVGDYESLAVSLAPPSLNC